MKPVVGHRFTHRHGPSGAVQPCEVTAVDPERRLEYHFARGVLDSTIAWRLEPEDEGTRLYLEHAGFDLDSPLGRQAFAGMGNGWPHVQPTTSSASWTLERRAGQGPTDHAGPGPRVPGRYGALSMASSKALCPRRGRPRR